MENKGNDQWLRLVMRSAMANYTNLTEKFSKVDPDKAPDLRDRVEIHIIQYK